jgi:hypothetical protein
MSLRGVAPGRWVLARATASQIALSRADMSAFGRNRASGWISRLAALSQIRLEAPWLGCAPPVSSNQRARKPTSGAASAARNHWLWRV